MPSEAGVEEMVSFDNFHRLDPKAREVAIDLLANADHHPPPFMSFMYRWMAFNGWMSAVTLEDRDLAMINALVKARRLIAAHDNLIRDDPAYRQSVFDFAAMWPVFNVRDVRRKLGYDGFLRHNRAALLSSHVKRQPEVWVSGTVPKWEPLLRTIYQVRCNLFHGEKSPQGARDRDLIAIADIILHTFIERTGCFHWYDR